MNRTTWLATGTCISVLIGVYPTWSQTVPGGRIATYPDTWAATDSLGRAVAMHEQVGPPKPDRQVGLFYFLWLGQHGTEGPFDITRILAQYPDGLNQPTSPPWGPSHKFHFWGEPLFGYYLADDRWVLRKHAQMLADALVDVVIFDVTNQETYPRAYTALCEVFMQVRRDGGTTPLIAFMCPFGDSSKVVARLYEQLYRPKLFPDLWFRWRGKPLIIAKKDHLTAEILDFFTFRAHGPDYFNPQTAPGQWQWLQIYPQHVYRDESGKAEEISVGVAQNATGKRLCAFSEENTYGRSWHAGRKDDRPDAVLHGFNFAEQWEHALKIDPEFIFITGWNEWIALRLPEFNGVKRPVMFVDAFTQEYSRDAEPMKGGHADNYYYQMVSYIRRFKGARPSAASGGRAAIRIDGEFNDWEGVRPEYRDDAGDVMHRDHAGYDGAGRYVNNTGRNDIVLCKVCVDDRMVYFYAMTARPISSSRDRNWMLLFVDADSDAVTGWNGYDFVVNRRRKSERTSVLQRYGQKSRAWENAGTIEYRVHGRELELAVPRAVLGLSDTGKKVAVRFKWADNMVHDDDVMDFTVNGDAAPNGRFQFVYHSE